MKSNQKNNAVLGDGMNIDMRKICGCSELIILALAIGHKKDIYMK